MHAARQPMPGNGKESWTKTRDGLLESGRTGPFSEQGLPTEDTSARPMGEGRQDHATIAHKEGWDLGRRRPTVPELQRGMLVSAEGPANTRVFRGQGMPVDEAIRAFPTVLDAPKRHAPFD